MKYIFLLLFLFVAFLDANTLNIQKDGDAFTNFEMEVYEDKSAALSLEDIEKKEFHTRDNTLSTGYSQSAFWLRVKVKNSTNKLLKYYFYATESFADSVEFYALDSKNNITKKGKAGLSIVKSDNKIHNTNPKFAFVLHAGETKELYIRQYGVYPNYTSFYIMNAPTLSQYKLKIEKILMLYLGALLALIIYNFFIYLSSRDIVYLFYVGYTLSFGLWQLTIGGFYPFNENSSTYAAYSTGVFIPLWISMLAFFARKILDTKNLLPAHDKFILFIGYLYLFLAALCFVDIYIAYRILNMLATFVFPYLLYVGIMSYKSGNKVALFFVVAQGIFLIFSTLFSLLADGYIGYNLLTRYGIVFGSFSEILLFSFALSYKLKLLQEEKLALISGINEQLELKVEERTQELKKLNKALEKSSKQDRLTGILNRYGIDMAFEKEMYRYRRYREKFGVILVDIDYFKAVNDEYGHLVGDEVLKVIVSIIQESIREGDTLGRWGGEEFLIICPEMNLPNLSKLAERICANTRSYKFPIIGHKTVSCGMSVIGEDETKDDLLSRVDEALYKAKNSGRNRVCQI